MSSVHKRAHKAPLLIYRKFLDEAITEEEIGVGPRCKATVRGEGGGRSKKRWEKRRVGGRVSKADGRGEEGKKV